MAQWPLLGANATTHTLALNREKRVKLIYHIQYTRGIVIWYIISKYILELSDIYFVIFII